ncbi:MAG: lipopolysaccharide core heptose(II) kinase RfaY [Cetobacterium sp.]|uniref:lipopolysaccharide core heptose(II) kinase RfaY n=1 Tax=Cetobacterium sp. TaxID=2071632 RepID=UPI003F3177EA
MKTIVDKDDTKVYYDEENDEYIKIFKLKFFDKIRCLLRLKEYPGINFYNFSRILNTLEIKTLSIKKYNKYSVISKNVCGISLEEYINNEEIMKKYFYIIKKIYENKIYSGDLALDNFLVKDNEIYAIDLEGYRKMDNNKRSPEEFKRRFKELMDFYNINGWEQI